MAASQIRATLGIIAGCGVQVAEEGEEVGDEVGVDFRSSSTEIWRR